jgi:hypothetical protein
MHEFRQTRQGLQSYEFARFPYLSISPTFSPPPRKMKN